VTLSLNTARFMALAVCFTIAGACARARVGDLEPGERRAFPASSTDKELFIRGEFDGVAEIWKDSILIQVTRGRIDTRGRRDDGVMLRAALASGDTAGRWRLGEASNAASVPGIRRDDAGRLIGPLRFSLKRPAKRLGEHWLVFVFEVESSERAADGRPLLHTAFAHSQPDLFAERSAAADAQP
jgi:hypothetical protein